MDMLIMAATTYRVQGRKLTLTAARRFFCREDADALTGEMVKRANALAWLDRIENNDEAGRLANLTLDELMALQASEDIVLVMCPIDETEADRTARREARARQKAAERQAKRRQQAKVTNGSVTVLDSNNRKRDSRNVTLRDDGAPAAVLAAIHAGRSTTAEIIGHAAGHSQAAIKMALKRLIEAGAVARVSRGQYEVTMKDTKQDPARASAPAVDSANPAPAGQNPRPSWSWVPVNQVPINRLLIIGPAKPVKLIPIRRTLLLTLEQARNPVRHVRAA
jgi:hypothetical protein